MRPPEHQKTKIGRAPDFTNAFLVTAGVLLFCMLMFVWALYGFLPAIAVGYILDQVFKKYTPFYQNGIKPRQ